jgi:DNA-binding winged helix-turn-helix (wHTH) protein/TolB-like protein/Tfp pilus assembly protein PilF
VDTSEKRLYEFGPFHLDPGERLLLRDGIAVSLEPKVLQTLVVLVRNSGHLLTKDELMKELWPDTFVEEGSLTRNISTLRRTLSDGSNGATYIETVPRQGYRFVAAVNEIQIPQEGPKVRRAALRIIPAKLTSFSQRLQLRILLLLIGVAVILGSALVYIKSASKSRGPASVSTIRSIAVLPFKPLSAQRDDLLDVGLADSLITQLGKIKQLSVRPTSAVLKFAEREQDSLTIGRELAVDAVLESRYQRIGDRLKINSQLVRVSDGKIIWAFQCSDQCIDILMMQESVSTSIARQLNFDLTNEERRLLTKRYTDNAEAYQLYLNGRAEWNKRTRDSTEKAIDFFQQAIERDSNYAPAYSGLADCYIALGSVLADALPRGVMPKAKYAAQRAIQLDYSLAEAHASLGFELMWYEWDFSNARHEFERAIELDPKYATAHQWYAVYLTAIGHHEEAIREARLACDLDPTSPTQQSVLGYLLYFARQYNQAIEQAEKAHALDSRLRPMYSSAAYIALGRYGEGVEYDLQANKMAGEKPEKLEQLRTAFETGGIRAFWKTQLRQFTEAPSPEGETTRYFTLVYALLGEKSKALNYLEKMYQERSGFLIYLKVDPRYDNLRGDPRFDDLLRRVGLYQDS